MTEPAIHPWNQRLYRQLLADREHLPHAVLLHGPLGVGKRDLAQAIAQSLLCETPVEGCACGACDACNWFVQGNHPDFRRVEPVLGESSEEDKSSEGKAVEAADLVADKPGKKAKAAKRDSAFIKIEAVRELGQFFSLSAHRGGWRVAVIHPAEAMNLAAANALLKTLEEPPAGVLLILVTHQMGRLLPTVVSRCRKIHVPLPEPASALSWLQTESECGAIDDVQSLLAESGGAPLLARTFADSERSQQREALLDFLAGDKGAAGQDVSQVAEMFKLQHVEVWGWLLRWVHDLLEQRLAGRAHYYLVRKAQSARVGSRANLAELLAFQRELMQAGRWLRHPLQPQLLLESWLIRYTQITRLVPLQHA